jgi:hypothetical protein
MYLYFIKTNSTLYTTITINIHNIFSCIGKSTKNLFILIGISSIQVILDLGKLLITLLSELSASDIKRNISGTTIKKPIRYIKK